MKDRYKFLTATLVLAGIAAGCGCNDCDAEEFPEYLPDPCAAVVNQGGIAGWIAVHCSVPFVDDQILALEQWEERIAAGKLRGRINGCRIKGGIPAPDYTEVTRGSCGTAETVSKSQTITLQDLENDDVFSGEKLYDYIERRGNQYDFYLVDCEGKIAGKYRGGVKAYKVKPDTNEEDEYFEIVITAKIPRGIFVPLEVPFLADLDLYPPVV